MKHYKLLLTLYFIMGLTLTNCNKQGNCPPYKGRFFDIQGIDEVIHYKRISEFSISSIEDNEKIAFKDYTSFSVNYSVNYLSSTEQKPQNNNFGQLYAFECNFSGEDGAKSEKYKNIYVITLNDFSNQYKQGDTINEILLTFGSSSIDEYIKSNDTINIEHSYLSFGLKEKPTLNSKFKVKVFVELNTGEKYSKESTTVEFAK